MSYLLGFLEVLVLNPRLPHPDYQVCHVASGLFRELDTLRKCLLK